MSKSVAAFVRLSLSFAFILSLAGAAFAQTELTGEWTASLEKNGKINLNFKRLSDTGSKNSMGHSYDFAELQGLTREQAASGGAVKFSLVREAGRVDCEGSFQNGTGSGTFRFTGSQSFLQSMKERGFDFAKFTSSRDDGREPEHRLFWATLLNVTTALGDDLLSAGLGKLDAGDLFKAAIFKVDSKFMREMKESGFPGLGMEELVKARIFKIDANFVREAARMGFDKEPFESLVKMRIFKVTPAFVAEVRGEGLNDLTVEDLVKMKIFKIDAEYIRQAKADGTPLEVEELVQKRIGVRRRNRN